VAIKDAVYACTPSLACPTARGSFPPGEWVEEIRLSPDFVRTGVIHARTTSQTGPRLWISRDGGGSFQRFASAQRIVDSVGRDQPASGVRVESDPRNIRRLYLRVWGKDTKESPAEQIFRSDDDGRTWTRLGYWRPESSAYGRGVRGWPGPSGFPHRGREAMAVLPDGSLLAVSLASGGPVLYCSSDGARSWRATC
jgi:hypothetical protein